MQAEHEKMRRLREGGQHASALEARVGALLDEARSIAGLSDREIALIERRLFEQSRGHRRFYLFPALAALTALLTCGSVVALVGGWHPRLPRFGSTAAVPPTMGRAIPRHVARAATPLSRAPALSENELPHASSPVPEERPAPAEIVPPPPRPSPSLSRRFELQPRTSARPRGVERQSFLREASAPSERPSVSEPDRTPHENGLSAEAQSLAKALARWRRDNDAEGALALLDSHQDRFEHGAFAVESNVARAEILLALGRRSQALEVLDSLNLEQLPLARELQTIRGELRGEFGRCQESREDLSRVVLKTNVDELGQRAIRAIAKCP